VFQKKITICQLNNNLDDKKLIKNECREVKEITKYVALTAIFPIAKIKQI
jgi:hypothetical protein